MLAITDSYTGRGTATARQIDTAYLTNGVAPAGFGALVVKYADLFGFKAEALAGQISEETGWLKNWWTTAHNNILSLGVTGEATSALQLTPDWQAQDTPRGRVWLRGYHFATLEAGLLAGCIHMATYIYGRDKAAWPTACRGWCGDAQADPRLPALLGTKFPGSVKLIRDLGNGVFAANPNYAAAIVGRANAILGFPSGIVAILGVPATTAAFYAWLRSKGVAVVEDYVDDGWVGRGGMQPEAIVHHVTDGLSVSGSISWWRNASVEASTQRIIAGTGDPDYADGTLVVTRKDEDTAWANGQWSGTPRLDLSTLARWKAQNINPNRVTLAVEHSGKPARTDFPSVAQMRTSLWNDLHWIAKYPAITPDRAHLLRHADIDPVNRSNCPGPRFNLDKLIADIAAQLAPPDAAPPDTLLRCWEAITSGRLGVAEAWLKFMGRWP
jgi:hypothetical protein